MMTIAVVSVTALLIVLLVSMVFRRGHVEILTLDDVAKRSRPVDLRSFRNLVDPQEEIFLRSTLSGANFRRMQRARMLAALEYVRCTSHNAHLLVQLADAARRSSNPDVAKAGVELANSALQLRLYSLLAMGIFGTRVLVPSLPIRSSSIITSYGRLCDSMTALTRVQVPSQAAQVEAAL